MSKFTSVIKSLSGNIPNKLADQLGYLWIKKSYFKEAWVPREQISNALSFYTKLADLDGLSETQKATILQFLPYSRSQVFQDLFVVSQATVNNINPFFVEFGVTDGITLSNTYLLEKHLGWKGIVAEPARVWHEELKTNRQCEIDFRCVTDKSGEQVDFLEVSETSDSSAELSSIAKYSEEDWASNIRTKESKKYQVSTISLNDLLEEYKAPTEIGYLSVDTEGSELMILQSLDFSKYKIKIITVEHNFVEAKRNKIFELLTSNGFKRVFEDLSNFDDWYIAE